MLDAVEASLREMFDWAAARARTVDPALAPLVGEAAAEAWLAGHAPKATAERALWLKAAQAVLPLIPSRPAGPDPARASSLAAMQAARRMVGVMAAQALGHAARKRWAADRR
ncbi:hypothetical protein [Roseomonas sp. 18066]|uniref:hypothetical protein n=1 Tax=Roseomonas sp. 18066 TaxID=2681412 RepID=UPI001357C95A|nr:hypothetical protein [Roseomonas sp. 18066]